MHLVCVFFTFEYNTGRTDLRTDGPTDGRTYGRTDTTSHRDATAHLKNTNVGEDDLLRSINHKSQRGNETEGQRDSLEERGGE